MKKPVPVAQIGDSSPLNWGGYIVDHGDGRPTLRYMIGSEGTYWVHGADILDIETDIKTAKSRNGWIDIGAVARSCGESVRTLIRAARGNWVAKACVIEACAGYYGWGEFDSYPVTMTEAEAEKWEAKMDRRLYQWRKRKGVKSYTWDAAFLMAWEAANENATKYGRGHIERGEESLRYKRGLKWDDWDRGYLAGFRARLFSHVRPAGMMDFVAAYPLAV
jgi:hypothetical protein